MGGESFTGPHYSSQQRGSEKLIHKPYTELYGKVVPSYQIVRQLLVLTSGIKSRQRQKLQAKPDLNLARKASKFDWGEWCLQKLLHMIPRKASVARTPGARFLMVLAKVQRNAI